MDDNFRARVQKAFGSLPSSQSPWSLTGGEVEKREWNRRRVGDDDANDETPGSPTVDGIDLEDDLEDVNDDDVGEDEQLGGGGDVDCDDREVWEIRSSIGRDCTLDNEEEEDEYDKVAEGRENAGDRLYMSDVTNHGPYLNSYNVLPNSVHENLRDPRANHFAARIRLKEDEIDSQKIGPSHTFDKPSTTVNEHLIKVFEDVGKPKSIMKRKHDAATSKEQKRVRFDSGCNDETSEDPKIPSVETTISDDNSLSARNPLGVPDYLLNPSKYTRYSFDSSGEVDDSSNSQIFMDFLKTMKKSKPEESTSLTEDASSHLPKSIPFVPRKKANGARPIDSSEVKKNQGDGSKQSLSQTGFPPGIAVGETQGSEVSLMEVELETSAGDTSTGFQKSYRNYRARSELDDPEK